MTSPAPSPEVGLLLLGRVFSDFGIPCVCDKKGAAAADSQKRHDGSEQKMSYLSCFLLTGIIKFDACHAQMAVVAVHRDCAAYTKCATDCSHACGHYERVANSRAVGCVRVTIVLFGKLRRS